MLVILIYIKDSCKEEVLATIAGYFAWGSGQSSSNRAVKQGIARVEAAGTILVGPTNKVTNWEEAGIILIKDTGIKISRGWVVVTSKGWVVAINRGWVAMTSKGWVLRISKGCYIKEEGLIANARTIAVTNRIFKEFSITCGLDPVS